jgi:glycopeptide antibiotics resistance protein
VVQFALPTLGSVELLANVALFFPLVFFATLATRRPVLVLAAGTGLSAVIEAVQAALHDIGRSCDTNDWFMNTIGVVLGVLAAVATIALGNRRMPAAPGA